MKKGNMIDRLRYYWPLLVFVAAAITVSGFGIYAGTKLGNQIGSYQPFVMPMPSAISQIDLVNNKGHNSFVLLIVDVKSPLHYCFTEIQKDNGWGGFSPCPRPCPLKGATISADHNSLEFLEGHGPLLMLGFQYRATYGKFLIGASASH